MPNKLFFDDFTGDLSKWNPRYFFGSSTQHQSKGWYHDNAVQLVNDTSLVTPKQVLRIETRPSVPGDNITDANRTTFTGAINTLGKYAVTFPYRVSFLAKFPTYTTGIRFECGGWNEEQPGWQTEFSYTKVEGVRASSNYNSQWSPSENGKRVSLPADVINYVDNVITDGKYHRFTMDVHHNYIAYYIDSFPIYSIPNPRLFDKNGARLNVTNLTNQAAQSFYLAVKSDSASTSFAPAYTYISEFGVYELDVASTKPENRLNMSTLVATSPWNSTQNPDALPLDSLSDVATAWGCLKLRTNYSGSAIRVRRSSDNTEQDIGFNGVHLDTASLLSFVGAGSGFITAAYDQSGNGRDWMEATTTKQPRIVDSGVLDTFSSKPSLFAGGNTQRLVVAHNAPATRTYVFGLSSNSVTTTQTPVGASTEFNVTVNVMNTSKLMISAGTSFNSANNLVAATPYIIATVFNGASSRMIYNTNNETGNVGGNDNGDIQIGEGGNSTTRWTGHMPFFITFDSAKSNQDCIDLVRSLGTYYGVTVV